MDKLFLPDDRNYAVVGVPEGEDGQRQMRFLNRKQLSGACKIDVTDSVVLHEDGRWYRDVAILRIPGGECPAEIASEVWAYHPDNV